MRDGSDGGPPRQSSIDSPRGRALAVPAGQPPGFTAGGAARPVRSTAARAILKHELEGRRQAAPLTGKYRGPADFVLTHGRWFEPRPLPAYVPPGGVKMCFGNAILAAGFYGFPYFEGYALTPQGELVLHAWNTDREGGLVDTTWSLRPGLAYLGVEFSPDRAEDATWEGDGSVLYDPKRGWPIYQRRWRGEPGFPETEFMRLARSRDLEGLTRLNRARREELTATEAERVAADLEKTRALGVLRARLGRKRG